jgi:hypothetical protein
LKWKKQGGSMANQILLYIGSALTVIWGIAHLFPTKSVVQGFGDISLDNKRIISMEWIIEGIFLIFIGVLVSAVTMVDPASTVSTVVYVISICGLLALALVSLFTGFRISFLPFRLCPFIFTASAVLIFIGGLL